MLEQAKKLAQQFLIIDAHLDVPFRVHQHPQNVAERTVSGHFDYPRAVEGGLNAAMLAIFIPPKNQGDGSAFPLANDLIDLVENIIAAAPGKFAAANSPAEIRKNFAEGLISLPMGLENGAPIEGKMENLRHFYRRGIRYITLTHAKPNHICDASYDKDRPWGGLSPFGRDLLAEMNRIGMIIDVSHVSDEAFYQCLEISRQPVVATHSSCRHFTPGFERNMDDAMIKALADKGGTVQINFGSIFLDGTYQKRVEAFQQDLKKRGVEMFSTEGFDLFRKEMEANPLPPLKAELAARHVRHAVNLAGIDHVGLGSDFDGVLLLPDDLADVSMFPNLIHELLKLGFSEREIEKICGENYLRVWEEIAT